MARDLTGAQREMAALMNLDPAVPDKQWPADALDYLIAARAESEQKFEGEFYVLARRGWRLQ